MKISLDWLGDFVTWKPTGSTQGKECDPREIARRITACTAEVDAVEVQGELLDKCSVGKILTIEKHPNADKLKLCMVQTGKGKKRVVCGGSNLREGMRIAFADIGTRVKWHGEEMMTIAKAKIRGEESEGMICTGEELGIGIRFPSSVGLVVVDLGDGDEAIGEPLREYLGLTDTVLHIDNHAITNRADLFSHVGFARECVAIGLATWKKKTPSKPLPFAKKPLPFSFVVDERKLMPRYCACLIEIDGLGVTPPWMKRRLESTGWRSLNLPIDITNYVAMEVGVPLHSFDADDIRGTVHMRRAKAGEKIITLDRIERELWEGALVLSDDEGVFDLLGIMGGLRSSTKVSTRRIYLHSASLDPVSIRRAMIAMGHRTDAGTVYEKGVPHVTAEAGFRRAAELFLAHAPGARIVSRLAQVGTNGSPKPISAPCDYIRKKLGAKISDPTMEKILTDLGFTVKRTKKAMRVTPPLFRLGDIRAPHDIVEEVGRIYGYDTIEAVMPEAPIDPPARDVRMHALRESLREDGYYEIMPLSLLGPHLLKQCAMDPGKAVSVENALGEEYSLMRTSMLPGLLEHAQRNLLLAEGSLRSFDWGHVFEKGNREHTELGMLATSRTPVTLKQDPFLLLKQHLTRALMKAGYELVLQPCTSPASYAHPGRCADLLVQKTLLGRLFEVLPIVREAFDLPHRAAAVTLNLHSLFELKPKDIVGASLPQFPAIVYDLTLTRDHMQSTEDLLVKVRRASALLESVEVADLYEGAPLAKGQFNLTLRCTYRAPDRTLTELEVQKVHATLQSVV